jgi:hypothetical protein
MLDQLLDAPAHGVSLDRLDRNSTGTRQELDRLDRQGLDNGLDSATTRASTAVLCSARDSQG